MPEPVNRGGDEHWSPTALVGLMNLVVDLLEARVMGQQPMTEYMDTNYGVQPDGRNRYFFEPGMTRDMDHHVEGAGSQQPGAGDYRHHLVPLSLRGSGSGRTRNFSGAEFDNALEFDEQQLTYRGQTHDGRSVAWPESLLPREMAGRSVDDLY